MEALYRDVPNHADYPYRLGLNLFNMPVLAFHNLADRPVWGVTNYHPRRLFHLLEKLLQSGCSLAASQMAAPDAHDNNRQLLITFDDGYESLMSELPGMIERFDTQPLVFIPTAYLGQTNRWDYSSALQKCRHLSREEIKELSLLGVSFGSHGHTHRPLSMLSPANLQEELRISREILQELTGQQVLSISYPFGRTNRRITDAAADAGYKCGYTMQRKAKSDNPLRISRIPVNSYDTPLSVLAKLSGGPLAHIERCKSVIVGGLSTGTILLNRLRGI